MASEKIPALGMQWDRWVDLVRYWPSDSPPKPGPFCLYVCGICGLQAKLPFSLAFARVPHFCHTKNSARMVK